MQSKSFSVNVKNTLKICNNDGDVEGERPLCSSSFMGGFIKVKLFCEAYLDVQNV